MLVKFAAEYQFDGVSKYYFRDPGAPLLAFEVVDKVFGKHLATPHAAPEVLSSMAELAQAMGWKDLTVKGTPEFKREMWLQGSLAGLKVWGYGPEPIDEIRLAELEALREKAAGVSPNVRAQGALNEVIEGGGLAPGVKAAAVAPLAGSDGSQDKPRSAAQAVATLEGARAQRLRVELEQSLNNLGTSDVIKEGVLNQFKQETFQRAYVGKLVEFGAAPYKFEKDAPRSFFVKLRTPGQKERVLWGVDFERLLQGEDDLIGKQLAFMLKVGQPIKIKVDVKDANGEVVGTEERQSVRNEWVMHSIEALVQSIVSSQEGHAQKVPAQSYQTASDLVQLEAQSLTPTEQLKQVLTGMGATTASVEMTIKSLESLVGSPQFHVGQYLSDGPVDYKGRSSHAIRLKTPDGPIEVVGADIKRALGEIQVKVGEPMVVAYRGIESVTDLEGNITHRNDWLVSPVGELHEQAQEGVIQRYALSGQKPGPTVMPDQGGLAKPDRQRLEILATAMRLAKVPAEFANLTLVQAHHMLQSGPAQAPRAAIPVTPSRTIQIDRPRKGPSI